MLERKSRLSFAMTSPLRVRVSDSMRTTVRRCVQYLSQPFLGDVRATCDEVGRPDAPGYCFATPSFELPTSRGSSRVTFGVAVRRAFIEFGGLSPARAVFGLVTPLVLPHHKLIAWCAERRLLALALRGEALGTRAEVRARLGAGLRIGLGGEGSGPGGHAMFPFSQRPSMRPANLCGRIPTAR